MALKGNLRDVGLNQLLNLIHLARKTGALSVQNDNGGGNARLYFREGKLIYAALDGQETRLTDMMVKIGKLNPDQVAAIRQRAQVDTDKALGLAMIQTGILTQADIVQGVKNYLLETVYQLLTWAGGVFIFEPNHAPAEERITVPINLDHLIIEGGRRVREFEKLREELPDLDVPLKFTERQDANLRNINLSVDQWKIISFINSRNTIRQIASYLKVDEFQIRRIVNGLQQAGLVELGTTPRVPVPVTVGTAYPSPSAPNVGRGVLLRVMDRLRGL
ncbi:MAG: DUF4388 domain-containing protein [Chloroflexi bacterium]|nr:DUF4388 domain-containing protein [Chloroflexota bacterium]